MTAGRDTRGQAAVTWGVLALYAAVLLRTAWLDDDCFITLRVIDNMAHGYGLRWNVLERVQVFTHPLWLLLIAALHAITREFFFSVVGLSIALSLTTAWLLMTWQQLPLTGRALCMLALTLSTSFVDYSSSGLENPLTHLLLVALFRFGLAAARTPGLDRVAMLLVALVILNREDALLLVLPAAAWRLLQIPAGSRARTLALGLSPLLGWKLFALVYYGDIVPNTAHAKLDAAFSLGARLRQGGVYFGDQLRNDPVGSVLLVAAVAAAVLTRRLQGRLAATGLGLYLLYVLSIGGSFMLGRFFAAPLLLAAIALCHATDLWQWLDGRRASAVTAVTATVVGLGLAAPYPTLLSGAEFGSLTAQRAGVHVSDERFYYYPNNGLLRALSGHTPVQGHPFHAIGRALRNHGGVHAVAAAGMTGFAAGPGVHLVDVYGITEPLLAQLPSSRRHAPPWVYRGVGHLMRRLPVGYLRSLREGKDHLQDRDVAALDAELRMISAGPILAGPRLAAIARRLLGGGRRAPDSYAQRLPRRVALEELQLPHGHGSVTPDVMPIDPAWGLQLEAPIQAGVTHLDVGLYPHGRYRFVLSLRGKPIAAVEAQARQPSHRGIARVLVALPPDVVSWDGVHVSARARGTLASISHLRPLRGYRTTLPIAALRADRHSSAPPPAQPDAVELFPHATLRVSLDSVVHTGRWDVSVDFNDTYALDFMHGPRHLGSVTLEPSPAHDPGFVSRIVDVPPEALRQGYDTIRVRVVAGDAYCRIAHLVPLP